MATKANGWATLGILFSLTGCSAMSPTFINDGQATADKNGVNALNPVHYRVAQGFKQTPPECIAILPLKKAVITEPVDAKNTKVKIDKTAELTEESLEQLRWNLYSHLAPHPYRDVELAKVDQTLAKLDNDNATHAQIGSSLNCDALLVSVVTDYRTDFFGLYSQTSIGVRMKLLRAADDEVLWEGNHVAKSHGGSVPLTPVDIAMGIYSASENVSDEQLIRVEDDLFRRLLSTWDKPESDYEQTIQLAETSEPEPVQQPVAKAEDSFSVYVACPKLFLRSGPGRDYVAKDVLVQNEKLQLLDKQYSPWVQVKLDDGQLGYVNEKYLTKAQ